MNRYANIDCPICGNSLDNGQSVVVCPECGAPYHLECYQKEGKCIFNELHEKNEPWIAPVKEQKYDAQASLRCSRCGTINPSSGIFCQVCGNQLNDNNSDNSGEPINPNFGGGFVPRGIPLNPFTTPFGGVSPDEDIDGIAAKDIAIFVGQNSHYFLPRFKLISQSRAKVINWAAFFFTGGYFLYRKMYGWGILLILLNFLFSISSIIMMISSLNSTSVMQTTTFDTDMLSKINTVSSFIWIMIKFTCGFFANNLYKKHVFKKIQKIKVETEGKGPDEYVAMLTKKGSVAIKLIMALLFTYLFSSFILVVISLFMGV